MNQRRSSRQNPRRPPSTGHQEGSRRRAISLPRCSNQQRSRPPPPPPPPPPPYPRRPPPPPPPPPGRSSRGLARFTVSARPPSSLPFRAAMAFWASSGEPIVTKANPRGRPVARSIMRLVSTTLPWAANASCRSFSVVLKERFPTNNFELIWFWYCLSWVGLRSPRCSRASGFKSSPNRLHVTVSRYGNANLIETPHGRAVFQNNSKPYSVVSYMVWGWNGNVIPSFHDSAHPKSIGKTGRLLLSGPPDAQDPAGAPRPIMRRLSSLPVSHA